MKNLINTFFEKSIKHTCLIIFILGLSYTSFSQPDLATNAATTVQIDNCCDGDHNWMSRGEAQDYRIPDDVIFNGFNAITFSMNGGDGGYAKAGSDCKSVGGSGASASITCRLGDGINQLKPGGKIRFIVGKRGENSSSGGTTATGGGGGGGTAVLYRETNSNDWIILAVAGGGGGAHQGNVFGACVDSQKGQGGRITTSGGDGGGSDGGDGGTNGGKGSKGDGGQFNDGGAGGGAYGGGPGGSNKDGMQGYPDGGNGGDNSGDNSTGNFGIGGWGFGGGGSGGGGTAGAGGGGYSGGGSGEVSDNGGGGGSYINHFYAYNSYLGQGHSDGNSQHGSVTYNLEDVCSPVITTVEEIQGFCDDDNPSAYIDVDISGDFGCDQVIYYKLYGPSTVNVSTTGIVEVPYPADYTLRLEVIQSNGFPVVLDSRNLTFYDEDVIAPVVSCLPTYSIELVSNPQLTNLAYNIDNGSYDNCVIASITSSKTSFDCDDIGVHDITFTFADEAGNTSDCIVEVTVEDSERPVPDIQILPTINTSCATVIEPPTATDVCAVLTGRTNDPTAFYAPGTYTINWYYIDSAGNSTTQEQTVIITDDSPPTAICPADITVDLEAGQCSSVVDYIANSSDNCESVVAPVLFTGNSSTVPAGRDRLLLVQMRGNSTLTGVTSVTYNGMPMSLVIRETGRNAAVEIWYLLLGTGEEINSTAISVGLGDWSSTQYITFENVDQDNPFGDIKTKSNVIENIEIAARTHDIIYEGASRNSSTKVTPESGQIEIFDHRPNFNPARNWGAYLPGSDEIRSLSIDFMYDALRVAVIIRARHATSYDYSVDPGSTFQAGITPVTFTVTDKANQSDACAFNVIVNDTDAPEALCKNKTIQLDANGNAAITTTDIDNGSNDVCGNISSLTLDITSFDCDDIGTHTVTMTAKDESDNTNTCQSTVTVEDNIAPTAVCQNKTIQLDANGEGAIGTSDIDNNSSDACGISELSLDNTSYDCDDIGTHTVTLTIKDNHNNTSTCQATVTVEDNVAPTALCQDKIVQLDANGEGILTNIDIDDNSSDACGIAELSLDNTSFDCDDIGTHTVTLTVKDANDNTSTCQSTVTVEDNVAPIALCKNKTVQLDANGEATITTTDIDNNSSDVCSIVELSLDNESYNCDDVGTHTVTLTARDDYDNTNTCQATVTVRDNIAPTAVCQNQVVQLDANGKGSLTAADIDNNSTDACGISSLSINKTNFNCSNEGTRNIQLTVTDNNGNSSTCNAAVTVEDNIAPVALCQNKTVQLDANGAGSITTTDINNNSTDACGIESLELDNTHYSCMDVGTHTVTLRVEDIYGNESTCQSMVTVEDNVAPVALCQNKTIQLDANGAASISAGEIDDNSNDACGISTLSLNKTSFDCNDVGTNTIVLTVKDVNNNTSTCQSIVTVEDNVAPVALCQDKTVQLDANGAGSISTSDIDNGSNDACGIASLSLDNTSFSCSEVGNLNMVTLTVTDNNGNTSTCQASITVEDNIAPTALCHNVIVSLDSEGNGTLSASEVNNNSYDNCGIASMSISQSQFSCNDIGVKNVTLTVIDIHGHLSSCLANIDTEVSGDLASGWTSNDIGLVTVGNDYWYDPCEYPPLHYVTGSGNNATSIMTDNVAFMAHNTCGDFTFTAKIESVDPNGYGGLMVRDGMEDGAKQVALFSNLSNTLRHEVRYNANTPKQIGSFFKPNPIWLRIQRQGDWIFSYSSYDGTNFQYVHGVFIQMDNCLEVGMASFTYMPVAQTEVVFSNVSISGSNGGFSANDDGLANTEKPQHLNTATPKYHNTSTPKYHNTETPQNHITKSPYRHITLFPNPNQGQFTIQLDRPIEENTTVYIYNQYGQQVHSEQLQQGATQLQLYLEQLASGTYWLKMNGTSHTIATKVFTVTND